MVFSCRGLNKLVLVKQLDQCVAHIKTCINVHSINQLITYRIVRGCCKDTDALSLDSDARMGDWREVIKWGRKNVTEPSLELKNSSL